MMTALWVSIPLGLLTVLIAVGAPFWLSRQQTPEGAVAGEPGELQQQPAAAHHR